MYILMVQTGYAFLDSLLEFCQAESAITGLETSTYNHTNASSRLKNASMNQERSPALVCLCFLAGNSAAQVLGGALAALLLLRQDSQKGTYLCIRVS